MNIKNILAIFLLSSFILQSYAMQPGYSVFSAHAKAWMSAQYNKANQSIRKHPWAYLTGVASIAALVGLGIFKYKKSSAVVISPVSVGQNSFQENILRYSNVALTTPQQALSRLRGAVMDDLTVVENLIKDSDTGIIDLKSINLLTQTTCIETIPQSVKDMLLVVGGLIRDAPNISDLQSLNTALDGLRALLTSELKRYS